MENQKAIRKEDHGVFSDKSSNLPSPGVLHEIICQATDQQGEIDLALRDLMSCLSRLSGKDFEVLPAIELPSRSCDFLQNLRTIVALSERNRTQLRMCLDHLQDLV